MDTFWEIFFRELGKLPFGLVLLFIIVFQVYFYFKLSLPLKRMGKRTEDLETENRNLKIRNEILYKRLQDKTFNQDNEDWMRTGKCPVRLEDYISELVKNIK